jgi:hypothetical protein
MFLNKIKKRATKARTIVLEQQLIKAKRRSFSKPNESHHWHSLVRSKTETHIPDAVTFMTELGKKKYYTNI